MNAGAEEVVGGGDHFHDDGHTLGFGTRVSEQRRFQPGDGTKAPTEFIDRACPSCVPAERMGRIAVTMSTPINATELMKQVWADLRDAARGARLPEFTIMPFREFFENAPQFAFPPEQRHQILVQSRLLFANYYVHAPFKRQRGLLDPLRALDELALRIDSEVDTFTDDEFHRLVRRVFVEQQDAHTFYGLPKPYADALAFLPFQLKRYFDGEGQPRIMVSKVMPGFAPSLFGVGAEIVGWSGESILLALRRSGDSEIGGNHDAFLANALARMTLRPLRFAERPDSGEELIEFRPAGSDAVHSILIPWGVGVGFDSAVIFPPSTGCAEERAAFGYAHLLLMNPKKCAYEQNEAADPAIDSLLPQVFEFRLAGGPARAGFLPPEHLQADEARLGYIRIKTFLLPQAAGPLESVIAGEFARLLRLMAADAPDGLILDLRGNMGGSIRAAETMLQMISPTPITPARFHWRFTGAVRQTLAELNRLRERFAELTPEESSRFAALSADYSEWLHDATTTDAPDEDQLSTGQPLTANAAANEVGQIYQGAVVLLVDAFTYSAGDIFAGGFQDHGIGPVLGITETTGGGGAAKWNYAEFAPSFTEFAPLPGGVTMSMAILRSSRVRAFAGQFIEDIGVQADMVHRPTHDDVLFESRDLMAQARELLLAGRKHCRLAMVEAVRDGAAVRVRVEGGGYASVRFELDDEPVNAVTDEDGWQRLEPAGDQALRLAAFGCDDGGDIIVNTRMNLPASERA